MGASSAMIQDLRRDGHIICDSENGDFRILDHQGRIALDMPPWLSADSAQISSRTVSETVKTIADEAQLSCGKRPRWLSIDICWETIRHPSLGSVLERLIDSLESPSVVSINLHFIEQPADYAIAVSLAKQRKNLAQGKHKLIISLVGPLGTAIEHASDELFEAGVALQHVPAETGLFDGQYENQRDDRKTLQSLAEYGYRIPIVWYTTAANLPRSQEAILSLLDLAYYGGVLAPLASVNPYYGFLPTDPALPSGSAYCEFLTALYANLKHFDSDLAPLNELAILATLGGWHAYPISPRFLKVFINKQGIVGVFKQSPACALPWLDIATLTSLRTEEIRENLNQFVRQRFSWENNAFCRDCQWRDVCGGIDFFDPSYSIPRESFEVLCSHRLLFLEHFASSRVSDFDLQAALLEVEV